MNRIVISMLLFAASIALYAQAPTPVTYTVKGVLSDSVTLEGEPYATIRFAKKSAPDKAVKLAVTNMEGQFEEKITGSGDYIMTITSVGRTTIVRNFKLAPGQPVYDFGVMLTADDANELAGVEVVAQRPLVKVDIDKIEYNIEEDPDSKTNSVLEMLRKVPLVTVDGEDNIQVNGSSSFKIHVNGKPNNMMSDNPKEVLRSMPANSIKHIEVITDPGAKYDAEGVGGILNIVTIGGSGIEGYTVTFSGRGTNTGIGGSLYGTIKKNKLTLTGNYSYNHDDYPRSYSSGERSEEVSRNELKTYSTSKGNGNFQYGNLEGSYEVDTLRLITLAFGMYGGGNDNDGFGWSRLTSPEPDNNYYYESRSRGDNSWYSIRGNIDYQRLFSVKDRMLTFSYRINSQPRTNDNYTDYDKDEVPEVWMDILKLQNQHYDQERNSIEHTIQADFVTPIGKYHSIETGLKYIRRNNTSDTRYYNTEGDKEQEIDSKSSNFEHLNDIFALYGGYTLRYKSLSGKAGLRYEYTNQDVKYLDNTPGEDFKKDFNDIVPNVSLGYKLGQTSNIRGGYNLRIWRPSIHHLNPYKDTSNPTYISYGNPELKSEKNHTFNVSFSSFTQKFNVNVSLRHSFNNNGIERVVEMKNTGILESTYANIGKSSRTGLSAYINWNASSKTRIYMNLNGGYSSYKMTSGKTPMSNDGWNLSTYGGLQHTFPFEIRGSLNLYASTPWISLQGRGNSNLGYHLSLNRSFINKRLTISAFAGNFLQKYRTYKNVTNGIGFNESSESKNQQRRFGVSISYRIGELKAQVKRAARSIQNDDLKNGDGGGGESGGESN